MSVEDTATPKQMVVTHPKEQCAGFAHAQSHNLMSHEFRQNGRIEYHRMPEGKLNQRTQEDSL